MRISAETEKARGVGFVTKYLIAELVNEPEVYRARPSYNRKSKECEARSIIRWALHEVRWIREYEPNWTHAEIEDYLAHDSTTGEPSGDTSELVHKLIKAGHPGCYRY